jgi:hypothetical protein
MQRAYLERPQTIREWQRRHDFDDALQPGRYRKGHRALGCHRRCTHCRALKLIPTRKLLKSNLDLSEWLRELNN